MYDFVENSGLTRLKFLIIIEFHDFVKIVEECRRLREAKGWELHSDWKKDVDKQRSIVT